MRLLSENLCVLLNGISFRGLMLRILGRAAGSDLELSSGVAV